MAVANSARPAPMCQGSPRLYSSRRVSRLLAHPRKQEICLPVACLLVSVRSASQLFKLPTRRSLYDGLQRLQQRFSISLGESPRLHQECLLSHLALTVCSGRMRDFSPWAYSSLVAAVTSL